MRLFFSAFLALLLLTGSALAQDSSTEQTDLPYPAAKLGGLIQIWQQPNRCSAAALTIQLSYFGYEGTYTDTIGFLNPNSEDVSVRLEEMAAYAEQQGLRALVRTGGSIELLQRLVAAGFPVLIENVYFDGNDGWADWMSHNRVMMGYDTAIETLYFFDSLLGFGPDNTGRPMSYNEVLTRWRPFNYNYLLLYFPEDEATVQEVLGEHWDASYNAEHTLALAQNDLENYNDSFTYFNIGSALLALGRYEEAAAAFDQTLALGLPPRFLWYQFGPFEAYLQVGRYEDVIALARDVIASTPGVEEVYYYAARAYEALGDTQRAIANYEVAVFRNANFTEAAGALARLRGA